MKTLKHLNSTGTLLLLMLIVGSNIATNAQNGWEQMTSMDVAKGYATSCVLDSMIYVFGGMDASVYGSLDSVDAFNTKSKQWTDLKAMPHDMIVATAEAFNNKLYVLGGWYYNGGNDWPGLDSVYIYDPVSNTWDTTTNGPHIGCWGSCVINDTIWLFGGARNNADPSNSNKVWCFSPETEEWSSMPDMIDDRPAFGTAEIFDGKIYLIGGTTLEGWTHPTGKSEMYDPVLKEPTELSVMPVHVCDHIAVVHNQKILVFGGDKQFYFSPECPYGCSEGTNVIQEYDPVTDTWRLMKPMPFKRAFMVGEKVDSFVYLIGGYLNGADLEQPLNEVWRFDLDSLEEWCEEVIINVPEDQDTFEIGDKFFRNASVVPSDFANPAMIWSSDNESVAIIDGAYVKCVGAGMSTITAQLKYGGCSGSYNVIVGHDLINQQFTENIKIYPNPAGNMLNIETGIPGLYNIDITNLNGQLLFSKKMEGSEQEIDISSLSKGVYFVTIRDKGFVTTRKIAKL